MQTASREALSESRERIFEAALSVFSQKGRDGARMHEIARAAGLNPALLHYYFGQKDEIYEAVLRYAVGRYLESIADDLRRAESFEELLRRFIDGYIDFGKRNQDVLRLIMAENLSGGARLGEILREAQRSPEGPRAVFVRSMSHAIERGELRNVDPEQTMLTVISVCTHFLLVYPMLEIVYPEAADRDTFIAERKAHIFDLVYHGVKA